MLKKIDLERDKMSEIINALRLILVELHPDINADDEGLVDKKIIDSFDIVAIISRIADEFDIIVPADRIIPENFNSIATLAGLIEQLMDE